jgi:hypothetical protein
VADIHIVRSSRRIEGQHNEGWGIAALVVGLAVACAASAWWIHTSTYHHPTDLRFEAMGTATAGEGH